MMTQPLDTDSSLPFFDGFTDTTKRMTYLW